MTETEICDVLEQLETCSMFLGGVNVDYFLNNIDKYPSCHNIGSQTKLLRDHIISNYDFKTAQDVYDIVYDPKSDLFISFDGMAYFVEDVNREISKELSDCSRNLDSICKWLLIKKYDVPRNKTDDYYLDNGELKKWEPQERREGLIIPDELRVPGFRAMLCSAHNAGLLKLTANSCEWLKSKTLLAYFAALCTDKFDLSKGNNYQDDNGERKAIPRVCFGPFEKLFHTQDLRKSFDKYKNNNQTLPHRHKIVDRLFEPNE